MPGPQGFRELSYRILLATKEAGPGVEFLQDVCGALMDSFACSEVEIGIREHARFARWSLTSPPLRFRRLPDLALDPGENAPAEPPRPGAALRCPLVLGDEPIGTLTLRDWQVGAFRGVDPDLLRDVGRTVAVAVAYHRAQVAQRERVKELSCLYGISRLDREGGLPLPALLQRIAELLPPSWQYPSITSARIAHAGEEFRTPRWDLVEARLRAAIPGHDGFVEVGYRAERPKLDEGPFLAEERRLLDTVAMDLASILDRRQAREEQGRMQEQLRRADRLATIGQLAAGVAHELNEPLGAILGFLQLARKHADLPAAPARDLDKIAAAALHAREVVRKLMLLGRQTPPRRERLDLNEVVSDGLSLLGARCARQRIALTCTLAPQLPALVADRAQLHQVLINLVVNAIQALPEGGDLRIATARDGGALLLSVEDAGVGMTPEVLARIFDPFFTTKDVGEGTGLGLPVVQGIVEAHGGRIEVESRTGEGSRFTVRFPIGEEAP